MKDSLIIIIGFVGSKHFLEKFQIGVDLDILALTPSAMLSLDILGIPYKTREDFYKSDEHRNDSERLQKETEKLFYELDSICLRFVDFKYAYTGNVSYFIQLLTELLYLEKLSQKIIECYRRIYLLGNPSPTKLSWDRLKYSDLCSNSIVGGLSMAQVKGLENKIKILQNMLYIELISGKYERLRNIPFNLKAKAFVTKVMRYIEACKKEKKIPVIERWSTKNDWRLNAAQKENLFVIQDGYDLAYLKKFMPDVNFRTPIALLKKKAHAVDPVTYDFNEVKLKLDKFLKSNYPKLNLLITSLFGSYHREVVGRISYYKKSFEDMVSYHCPKALLFSVGSRDVIDCLFATIANKRNIPIFYFQHGGANTFFPNPYQKYVETDVKIKKTLILNSMIEAEQAKQNGSKCIALGSMSRYELISNKEVKCNNKILYCCGPPAFYTYRYTFSTEIDKESYQINREIVDVAMNNSIPIDIKLHPTEQNSSFHFFKRLIKNSNFKGARIIYGIPAEKIMKFYGLIILDFVGTAIALYALSLKIPIILYLKNENYVNQMVSDDLKRRCYLVNNRNMLENVLRKYSDGNLPSKWSEDIIDRYIYPLKNGHPGPNIANYIRSVCP